MDISKIKQKEIFEILLKIEEHESSVINRRNFKSRKIRKNIFYANCIVLCTAITLLVVAWFNQNAYVILAGLMLLLLCEILMIVEVIVDISYSRKDFWLFFRKPIHLLLRNVRISANSTIQYLPNLLKYSKNNLELAKKEIEFENEHFKNRTTVISGAIDKLGLFPSILATVVLLVTQLSNDKVQTFFGNYPNIQFIFFALVIVVVIFQFFSIFTKFSSLKLYHMAQVLDLVIVLKKEDNESPNS